LHECHHIPDLQDGIGNLVGTDPNNG